LVDFVKNCTTDVNTLVSRLASFILWFMQTYKINSCPNLFHVCLHSFLREHTECLTKFCDHLSDDLIFKPSTVKNYVENILTACRWFSKFRDNCKTDYTVLPG
jgi:hypothetical protein